jgi:hypothetical protein
MLRAFLPYIGRSIVRELISHPYLYYTAYKKLFTYTPKNLTLPTRLEPPPYYSGHKPVVHQPLPFIIPSRLPAPQYSTYKSHPESKLISDIGFCSKDTCMSSNKQVLKTKVDAAVNRALNSMANNGRRRPRRRRMRRNGNRNNLNSQNLSVTRYSAPLAIGSTVNPRNIQRLRRVLLHHSELVLSITGSSTFTTGKFELNVGLPASFPWLSRMAIIFEKYFVYSMAFHYVPAIPADSAGALYLAFDYDASETAPSSKTQFMMNQDAISSTIWAPVTLLLDGQKCRERGELYIRSAGVPGGQDIKTFDLGALFYATSGFTGSGIVGDLYLEYKLDLLIPTSWENESMSQMWADSSLTSPGPDFPFGNANLVSPVTGSSNLATLGYDATNARNTLTWNVIGYYLVLLSVTGTNFEGSDFILELTAPSPGTTKQFGYSITCLDCDTLTVAAGIYVPDIGYSHRLTVDGTSIVAWTGQNAAQMLIVPLSADIYNSTSF